MHILYLILSLLRSSLPPFIDILHHLPYRNGPFAERSDINRHRFVLPNNFLFVTWLKILSIYCLIEKFCQLIELFEFTEFLIFWFVLQNKLKFEYIFKNIGVCQHHITSISPLHSRGSYVLRTRADRNPPLHI